MRLGLSNVRRAIAAYRPDWNRARRIPSGPAFRIWLFWLHASRGAKERLLHHNYRNDWYQSGSLVRGD